MKILLLIIFIFLSGCDNSPKFGTLELGMTKENVIQQCENSDELAYISNLGAIAATIFQSNNDSSNELRNLFAFNNEIKCLYLDPEDNKTVYKILLYFDVKNNLLFKNSILTHFSIDFGTSANEHLSKIFNELVDFYSKTYNQTIPITFIKNNTLIKNPEFLDLYFTKFDDNIIIHMSQQSGVKITYCIPNICDEIINSFTEKNK